MKRIRNGETFIKIVRPRYRVELKSQSSGHFLNFLNICLAEQNFQSCSYFLYFIYGILKRENGKLSLKFYNYIIELN